MKRLLSFLCLVVLASAFLASCGTQRQSCAAYSSVEHPVPAENS